MTEPSTSAVELAVQQRIAAARVRIAAAKERRESLTEARQRGLARRHAQTLKNLAEARQLRLDTEPEETPLIPIPGIRDKGPGPQLGARGPGDPGPFGVRPHEDTEPDGQLPPELEELTGHSRAHLLGDPDAQLWRTAIHEAGHAVVGLAAGCTLRSVTLRANKRRGADGSCRLLTAPNPTLGMVAIAAGGLAQQQADPQRDAGPNMAGDLAAIIRILDARPGMTAGPAFEAAAVAVRVLFPLIEVVASALLAPKPLRALSCAEVEDVLSGAGRAVWVSVNYRLGEQIVGGTSPEPWLSRYVADGVRASHAGVTTAPA
ncbi:hypothetical protein [Streptomyces sp. NPDC126514]|uniref:hypothetical protein n=1 Tax=Streptomyces sp. NPDC126514 TaxID=3155210 RepID=UPI0033276C6C